MGQAGAGGSGCQHGVPIGIAGERHQFVGRASRGICAADDGAHAGTDHEIHRHAQTLERAQHTDVGDAAGTASRKDEPDARSHGGGG